MYAYVHPGAHHAFAAFCRIVESERFAGCHWWLFPGEGRTSVVGRGEYNARSPGWVLTEH